MFDDFIADFWKDKLVHLMHRNMVRAGAERLMLQDVKNEFDAFSQKHPDFSAQTNIASSSATFEFAFAENLKLRLFIQNQTKVSIMQKQGSDYVKLCDARFPNNPFPEIDTFLELLPEYLKTLGIQKTMQLQNGRRHRLAREFITALLKKKYKSKGVVWQLEDKDSLFELTLTFEDGHKEKKTLHEENFYNDL